MPCRSHRLQWCINVNRGINSADCGSCVALLHPVRSSQRRRLQMDHRFPASNAASGVVRFAATATNDVIGGFSLQRQTVNPMCDIDIGGWKNTKPLIRRVRCEGLGKGAGPGLTGFAVLLSYTDPNFVTSVQYICFSSYDQPVTILTSKQPP